VPFMNRWRPHKLKGPIGLVMTPTRELALQIATEAEKLAPSRKFRTVAVYGGARMGRQLEGLARGCDLVVGTPGRMLDHLSRGTMTLGDVKFVVLDEADRMLDIGFRPDIERILKRVAPNVAVIHGDLAQSLRERIMAAFRTGDIRYLIATDVMSRGIDVTGISHVINFDLPQDIESYVHRIGRTGRIGKDGV